MRETSCFANMVENGFVDPADREELGCLLIVFMADISPRAAKAASLSTEPGPRWQLFSKAEIESGNTDVLRVCVSLP